MATPDNPLLDFSGMPRFRDIRPEHVGPALDVGLEPVLAKQLSKTAQRQLNVL